MAVFETSLQLNCPIERVFTFLTRPQNLVHMQPPESNLTVLSAPEELEMGSRFLFEVQGYGITQKAEHEVIEFNRPHSFTDQQIKGPLKKWIHKHVLEPDGEDACTIRDLIEFQPPGGLAGMVMNEKRLTQLLEKGFAHRETQLKNLLEAAQ